MDLGESDGLAGLRSVLAQQQQPFLPEAVSVKYNTVRDICGCGFLTLGQPRKSDTSTGKELFAAKSYLKKEQVSS